MSKRQSETDGPEDARLRAMDPPVATGSRSNEDLRQLAGEAFLSSKASLRNWGGSFVCRPRRLFAPTTVEQCCAIVELARRLGDVECRAVGRSHSPGDLAFTKQWMLDMRKLRGCLDIDCKSDSPSITVLAGTFVSDMHSYLEEAEIPLAMRNLGSISEQTIGGLISTATHGTGTGYPVLSAAVQSMRLVCSLDDARGGTRVLELSRDKDPELFNATLCGLGATGLIVEVTLSVDHWFKLKQVSEECPIDQLLGPSNRAPRVTRWAVEDDGGIGTRNKLPPVDADAALKTNCSLGWLLAHHPARFPKSPWPVPPCTEIVSPAQIHPFPLTRDRSTHLHLPDDGQLEMDDEETRTCQARLDRVAHSAQHVRLAWFAHAGMCTISRINRTLDPVQTPGALSRVYDTIVGHHLVQAMLFYGRYQPSMLPKINRLAYNLTHLRRREEPEPAHRPAEERKDEVAEVINQPFDPSSFSAMQSSRSSEEVPLLHPDNPTTILVDAAPRVFNVNCLYRQYTDEWAIPMSNAAAALRVMRDWLDEEGRIANGERVHFPIEVRFVDADGIWLSPCYGRKTCYIGIVQYRPYGLPVRYQAIFDKYERLMRFFGGRPHWAKAHTCGPLELARLYPELPRFLKIRQSVDPSGVFLNPYTRRHLLGDVSPDASSRIFKSRM